MKATRILTAVLLLAAAILSACTKDYKEEDVIKYIREELGLSSYSVISGPEEVEGEDGYTDRIWTVSTKDFDLEEELVFHVCDDHYWGLEWVTNCMTDDLRYQKQRALLENFDMPDGFSPEEVPDSSGRPGWIMVVCGFDRREDLEKGVEFVRDYRDYASVVSELLEALYRTRDYACVRDYATKAIQMDPMNLQAHFWLTASLVKSRNRGLAKQALAKAKEMLGEEDYADVLYQLGNQNIKLE